MGSISMPMDEFTKQCENLDAQLEDGTLTQSAYDKRLEELTKQAFGAAGAEKARAASMLGGARAMSGLLAIANTSEEDFNKLTDAIYGSEGAAQSMADAMLDNLGGDVTKLKSKLEGTKLELYEKFEPALRSGTKVLGNFIDGLQWLIDHSSDVTAAIGGITTSLITFFIIVKRQALLAGLIKLITSLKTALTVLFGVIAANPVGALIAVLAGLVTALITLWNTSEDFRNFWIGVWGDIKLAVERQGKLIKDFWSGVGDALIGGAKRQYELITGYWSSIGKGIREKAQDAYDGITGIFETIPDWFESKFSTAWKAVRDVFSEGGEIFLGIKEGIETTFTTIVNGLIKGINKIITQPFKAINKTLNKIRSVGIGKVHPFKGLWDVDPISIPEIPYLEKGGILKKGQVGLLEGNGAEAVVPLDKNRKWVASVVREMDRASVGTTIGKTVTNNYNFNQTITSPKALSRLDIYRQTKNQLNFAKGVG
jgi:phage-related protein